MRPSRARTRISPGSEPDQQFAVAEVAYLRTAFASALVKGEIAGRPAVRVQNQQSWMSLGRRVHLECHVTATAEVSERRGEQFSGRRYQRGISRPGEVDGNAGAGHPGRADARRESRGQEAG